MSPSGTDRLGRGIGRRKLWAAIRNALAVEGVECPFRLPGNPELLYNDH